MFQWPTLLTYAFIMAYTPGPNNLLSMSFGGRLGFRRSYPFNLGVFVGGTFTMSSCALFGKMLYTWVPKVKPVLMTLGAAYMLYLAWRIFRSTPGSTDRTGEASFLSGVLLQLVNPKNLIFGLTAMTSYILPYYQAPAALLGFALLLATASASATVCWSLFGTALYRLFANHGRAINTVMALLLVYCAVSLFL